MMEDRARGCRLCAGVTASFIALQCNNQGGKAVGPCRRYKKVQ
jgi:hypothetical protein